MRERDREGDRWGKRGRTDMHIWIDTDRHKVTWKYKRNIVSVRKLPDIG